MSESTHQPGADQDPPTEPLSAASEPAPTQPLPAVGEVHETLPAPEGPPAVAPAGPAPGYTPPAKPRNRKRGWIIAGAAAGAVVLLAGTFLIGRSVGGEHARPYEVSWQDSRPGPYGQQPNRGPGLPAVPNAPGSTAQPEAPDTLGHDGQSGLDSQSHPQREWRGCTNSSADGSADCAGSQREGRDDIELSGDVLAKASEAALAQVGGEGEIVEAEQSTNPFYVYKLEVIKPDNTKVEVYLDKDFTVVASEPDN